MKICTCNRNFINDIHMKYKNWWSLKALILFIYFIFIYSIVSMIMVLIKSKLLVRTSSIGRKLVMTTFVLTIYAEWDFFFIFIYLFYFFSFCHTERNHIETPQCIKLTILEVSRINEESMKCFANWEIQFPTADFSLCWHSFSFT